MTEYDWPRRICYFGSALKFYSGVEQRQLSGFIIRRSEVRVLPPQPIYKLVIAMFNFIGW